MAAQKNIDIHAHFFPQAFIDLMESEGGADGGGVDRSDPRGPRVGVGGRLSAPLEPRFHDLSARLASMDATGVDIQALSLTTPMVYWAAPELGRKLSAAFNDGCAEYHTAHPERFLGLAMLPMQSPEHAIRELERAATLPGMRGVYMATQVEGKELSDPDFYPFYERIEAMGWTIFLHPVKVVDPQRLARFHLRNLIGNPTESAIAAAYLIFDRVLDRFPKLTFCLPHAGGSFPYLIGRFTHGWSVRPECRELQNPPDSYLRRFYYDTITHAHPALTYLIDLVGADRVVLGSDFCFDMSYEEPVRFVQEHAGLDAADQDLILGGNAARLLGL